MKIVYNKETKTFGIHGDRVRNLRAERAIENLLLDPRVDSSLANKFGVWNDFSAPIYEDTELRNQMSANYGGKLSPELEKVLRSKYSGSKLDSILNNYKGRLSEYYEGRDKPLEINKRDFKKYSQKFHKTYKDNNDPKLFQNALDKVNKEFDDEYNKQKDEYNQEFNQINKNARYLNYKFPEWDPKRSEVVIDPVRYEVDSRVTPSYTDTNTSFARRKYYDDNPYNATYFEVKDKIGLGPKALSGPTLNHENNHRKLHKWGLSEYNPDMDAIRKMYPEVDNESHDEERDRRNKINTQVLLNDSVNRLSEEQNCNRAGTMMTYLDPSTNSKDWENAEKRGRAAQQTYRAGLGIQGKFTYQPEPKYYMDPVTKAKMEENKKNLGME